MLLDGQCVTSGEIPDAIGWRGVWSILVECKASLADFYADGRKQNRRWERWHDRHDGKTIPHIGQERWYLCPAGVIDPARHTMPKGWGLLWATPTRIQRVVLPAASVLDPTTRLHRILDNGVRLREHDLLLSALHYYQNVRRARRPEA